jgi:hypothetical protein
MLVTLMRCAWSGFHLNDCSNAHPRRASAIVKARATPLPMLMAKIFVTPLDARIDA